MKTGLLLLAVTLFSLGQLSGKIRNGYERKLQSATASLKQLNKLLLEATQMSPFQRQKVKSQVANVMHFLSYYELTETLLHQLRTIAPDIYNEIDSIKDKRGRYTDVYVKLVPGELSQVPLEGVSLFSQGSIDEDANHSEYGEYSVSVHIWIVGKALALLCHELGHVKYIIPNLASYSRFYHRYYGNRIGDLSYIGHHVSDESGKQADAFMKRYLKSKSDYVRSTGKRPEPAVALFQKIEKNIRRAGVVHSPTGVVSTARDEADSGLARDIF